MGGDVRQVLLKVRLNYKDLELVGRVFVHFISYNYPSAAKRKKN